MSDGPPGNEDVLSFAWDTGLEDPGNVYFTLDEQSRNRPFACALGER